MKEFVTAVADTVNEVEWIEFKVDGTECRAVTQPSDGQIAYLMASNTRHRSISEKIGSMLNFLDASLDEDSARYLTERLLDPMDGFGLAELQELLTFLLEEWTGRPTERSSASTGSQASTGPSSTAPPPPPPTYSAYPPAGSATTSTPGSTSAPLPPTGSD